MKGLLSFLNLNFLPKSPDFALLLLRAGVGLGMLVQHGWNKCMHFSTLAKTFEDPLHITRPWSLGLTIFAEVVCSALLVVGFCTRFAALALAFTMGVAFFLYHKGALSGEKPGEMAALYLLGFLVILLAGPGRFSFDGNGGGNAPAKPH